MRGPLRRLLALGGAVAIAAAPAACKAPSTAPSPGASASAAAGGGSNLGRENRVVDQGAVRGDNAFLEMRKPTVLDAGQGALRLSTSETDVVMEAEPADAGVGEITYVIAHEDDKNYRLQFTSAANLERYRITVTFKRLFRGKYTVKAYADGDLEPVGSGRFEVLDEGFAYSASGPRT